MKSLNQQILSILQDQQMISSLQVITDSNGQNEYGDVTLKEAYERFNELSGLLSEEINSGRFDDVAHNRRNVIFNQLQNIRQHANNPANVIKNVEALYDHLTIAGLFYRRVGSKDLENEFKSLTKLKRSITDFKNKYSNTKKSLEFIDLKKKELEELIEQIENTKVYVSNSKEDAEINLQKSETALTDTQRILQKVKEIQQQIEEKRLSVETFSENIDEYKESIESLEGRAEELLSKRKIVDGLIKDSREALKLGSASGVSAAFSSQHDAANNKWHKTPWIVSAVMFLLLAAGFTAWAIGGWGIEKPDSLNSILGRVVGVAISIAGAAFCAKQYVRQKNIIEDYAYKAALSKSIVAFTEEIGRTAQEGDGKQISTYLTKVLDEIHKDPLRPRRDSESRFPSKDTLDSIKKLLEVINQKVT